MIYKIREYWNRRNGYRNSKIQVNNRTKIPGG